MSIRVLVVDDSGFFRRRIRDMLQADPALEVVGEAANGREAVRQAQALRPDVITMDIEMPEMDGISAVREIMRVRPTAILMFSSLTYDGAQSTLDALDAGAADFLPKRFADISADTEQVKRLLQDRVKGLGAGGIPRSRPAPLSARGPRPGIPEPAPVARRPAPAAFAPSPLATSAASRIRPGQVRLLVIGASTGGPVALQQVLSKLPATYPLPILLIQHMPASFTKAFAERLNDLCAIKVREAADGDALRPGTALLAPGGLQMGLKGFGDKLNVRLFEAGPEQFYKPSVDIAFAEAAKACPGRVLGVVLTGMGADGCEGARLLKQTGSRVWSQDEASSVIYGMPGAVAKAGLSDRVLPLAEVGGELAKIG
ncbi:protein-glutamate methylesterase/protein-glutamine glutaminase [Alkalilimnicola sp. S0819]|uniref:protein-glutamate methylesterase/protein-glutamine glutaminase n=1 Tax=Alkalilimnicola sp. S0819 TaxID=2613922 RepID=UPI001262795D|nr:chemotaxis response regulator protein-glutamate methylesterase [Alkalilimnicola sp. S0819]KAB7627161.1 chemotaxis response regulator protein-glutamate methylesterase [Alkalilimnicola sp. S0819]MPQ15870.1 chemotaxis-specific protein-glutamate methyltransferase CheB [Alkalilimnicola sp. S0819]